MMNLREYCRPRTIAEALHLLGREGIRTVPLAGGSGLVAQSPRDVEAVVDLAHLPFDYIQSDRDGLKLGSLTRLAAICDSPQIRDFASGVLVQAALRAGTSILRNQATLGGTLLTPRAADEFCAALLVLDAEVVLQRLESTTTLPVSALYQNMDDIIGGGILTEVRVAAPAPQARVNCARLAGSPASPPILAAAVFVRTREDLIAECRIAVAGAGKRPLRMPALEASLADRNTTAAAVSAAAIQAMEFLETEDDGKAGSAYRRSVLPVLICRAVIGALTS